MVKHRSNVLGEKSVYSGWESNQHNNQFPYNFYGELIGADLFVFIRWIQKKFDRLENDQNDRLIGVWIRNYVAEWIYDPIFDQEIEELEKSEHFLRGFYMEIGRFVEDNNIYQNNAEINHLNLFKKWKEIIGRVKAGNFIEDPEDMQEIGKKMQKLHEEQFNALLKNGEMENFIRSE